MAASVAILASSPSSCISRCVDFSFCLSPSSMATMSEFIHSLEGDEKFKAEIIEHLSTQGLTNPSDLGFLANEAGRVNEGIVHRGCPPTWGAEHYHVLHSAIMCQAQGRGGQTALTLLRLTPALVASSTSGRSVSAVPGAPTSVHVGKVDTRWCRPILVDDDVECQVNTSGCDLDTELSLADKEKKEFSKVLRYALLAFKKYGRSTERYGQALSGKNEEVLKRCLAARNRNARSLRTKVTHSITFFKHLLAISTDLTEVSEWQVAEWVRHQALANKTRGATALQALRWTEFSFGVNLYTRSELVRSQACMHADRCRIAPPVPARCPTEEQILLWEQLVLCETTSNYTKAYAGAFCAMAHGMLRWSDLQRSLGMRLTTDAVTAMSPMKNQKYLTAWAAPRRGFNGCDWAGPWVQALAEEQMPGKDFVLRACNAKATGFTSAIADYGHAQKTMRTLMAKPPFQMSTSVAATFGLHGFRHVYTTAMRQLDLPQEDIDDAGHWRRGSEMVRTYDSASCVHELQVKEKVRAAVEMGWRRVSSACLPKPSPCTPCPVQMPAPSTPGACPAPCTPAPVESAGASLSSTSVQEQILCSMTKEDTPAYVMDVKTDVIHVWQGYTRRGFPSAYTRCRDFRCGTPVMQLPRFMWAAFDPTHYTQCPRCFNILEDSTG